MEKFCSQNYCCYKRHRHRHREFPRQVVVSENHVISKALLRPNRFAEICERRMDKYHEHLKINQQKTHFKFRSAYCHFQNKDCDRRLVIPCGSVTYMGLGGVSDSNIARQYCKNEKRVYPCACICCRARVFVLAMSLHTLGSYPFHPFSFSEVFTYHTDTKACYLQGRFMCQRFLLKASWLELEASFPLFQIRAPNQRSKVVNQRLSMTSMDDHE